ncbi:hypothetical protein [Leptolyngbya sp. 7M]|uniref:hypothetical protein n=1 Tax=Leptolyngbya sp. 7M TaxID=2812896 RepID=UPI001B8CC564|nr:hypothetical protein [Leptolyngbya sp. 7M]QYO64503.1 hypothetical protein JVX88_33345 [Leptolyngbya sp. 7M]
MTVSLKRLFLVAITLLVIPLLGLSLWSSLTEPQITDRLQLYQTDLLLHVNELQVDDPQDANLLAARKAVLGNDPLKTALEQYQDVRQSAATNLQKFQQQLPAPAASDNPIAAPTAPIPSTQDKLQNSQTLTNIQKQSDLLQQLDLRIGLLQADQDNIQSALATWAKLTQSGNPPSQSAQLANVLTGLWSEPPQIFPNAEELLQKQLEGWFRYKALSRLYQLQQRTEALNTLEDQEQQVAQRTLVKLALVSTVPALGAIIGVALIVWLSIRWLLGAGQPRETTGSLAWQVPWDWETIAWVLIVGFFFAGQIAIPGLCGCNCAK